MRSLVVYEPPINGESISAEHIAQIRDAVDEGRLDDAIGGMARQLAGITDQELAIAMAVPPVRKRLRDGVNVVARELDAIRLCDWSGLPVADVPALVVRGERSAAAAYPTDEQTSRLATQSETATLADQGHLGQVFAPTNFADSVLRFLDRH